MTAWQCEELRAVAADLALDELTGAERAAALGHVSECADCRAAVADLAAVADSLLLLAPTVEPPAGFESRVLARFQPVAAPRRRRLLPAAAVLFALAAGAAGYLAGRAGDDGRALPLAAVLRSADGRATGSVFLADGPDRMTCVFEDERFGGSYDVEVVLADGSVVDVGSFSAEGAPWSWTVPLPVDAADVRGVRVFGEGGVLRATAEVD